MIRKCLIDDLDLLVDFAFNRNSLPKYNCGFCSKTRQSIKDDFSDLIDKSEHIVIAKFQDRELIGLLALYIDFEKKTADCIGPFVKEGFDNYSYEMFSYCKDLFEEPLTINFFFDKRNEDCLSLMKKINATDKGNEKILSLKKSNNKNLNIDENVIELPKDFKKSFVQLHDLIFPNVYVSGKDIIETLNTSRKVFSIIEDNTLCGYSVLKVYKNSNVITAEIIAVDEKYRGKGYGKALITKVINEAFKDEKINEVHLVVDDINHNALGLYYSLNFEILVENYSFESK